MNDLLDALRRICGDAGVLTGDDVSGRAAGIWNAEGIRAQAIVRPRSTAEVAKVLAACDAARRPVVTHGGLTGLAGGALTAPGDVALSLERMNAIESVDPVNRTLVCQAGCTLQAVQEAASGAGLQFALDLGARGSATVGGIAATNAGGTRVIRYGMAREQLLGLEAVLADGAVLSSMNRMLKNNAGYDLKQLFIGSEGTLGVITRLVLRLREYAGGEQTALVAAPSLDAVTALLRRVDAGLGGRLCAYEVMWRDFYRLVTTPPATNAAPLPDDHAFYVLIEALGAGTEVFERVLADAMDAGQATDAVLARSGQDRAAFWALRDDVEQLRRYGPAFSFDVSLAIPDMKHYVDTVRAQLRERWPDHHCWVFGHLGDGNLHIVVCVGDESREAREVAEAIVYEPLQAVGGSVAAEHGIGLDRKRWLPLSRSADEIAAMRRLKHALDPNGILNPGKVFDAEIDAG